MDLPSLLIGAGIGVVIAYALAYFYFTAKTISKSEHQALVSQWNETRTQLSLAEDRLKTQQSLHATAEQKSIDRETALNALQSRTAGLEASLQANAQRLKELADALTQQSELNRQQQSELNQHQKQVVELRTLNQSLAEKLETQKTDMVEMQRTAHLQFEKIAQQIFEEKSGKFTEANKANIESLLKPLGENIESFRKKVEETYDKESKQRFSLEEKVKDLIENTTRISQEANNLASALKGQTKKQGDWGETILESILEKSGLVKDREYTVQENLKDEDGNNIRPDVIVKLPDARHIVIDSKVTLTAYTRYTETENPEEQKIQANQHLQAIYQHVDDLGRKKYHEYTRSLDFVIMFVPVEPAYLLAIQTDPELWSYAYGKRVLLISPTNLIAVLKIVADLWKRENQNKHALAIASEGSKLYEKFIGFLTTLEDLGRSITKTQESYSKALLQLRDGKGNLLQRAERLKELGIKSSKKLPGVFQTSDPDEEEPLGLPDRDEESGEA